MSAPRGPVTGAGIDRVEGRLKVTGKIPYAPETPVANVAHAVIVGSAVATGRIQSIDTRAAERAPGVLRVFTHKNAPRVPGASAAGERVLQLLQDDAVRYADQPIAVVVADTLENAQRAARLVNARYQAGTPNVDIRRELDRAYKPEKVRGGQADSDRGDFDRGLAAAAARVDATYTTPSEHHNPMEPHGTIAVWQGSDKLTVYDSTQGIFGTRKRLAALFGLPPEAVRVICLYVGGGFGCKGTSWSHVALGVMAARAVGRPVKLVLTRPQMFSLVGHRPVTIQRVVLGADKAGRLTAIRHDVHSATSRFDEFVEPAATHTRVLYACPNVRTSHRLVRVDIPTPTFTRAPGEASGTFALESAMDELAHALKGDPLELRLINHADRDPESGKPWSSKSLRQCYRVGAERFGWAKRKPEPRSMRDGRALVGWGMATANYAAGQSPASAEVRVRADGTAVVQTGSQDLGTGTYTILAQIAADELGLPVERVRVELGDTRLPEAPLSAGSRTASSVGSAVRGAAARARAALAALAGVDVHGPLDHAAILARARLPEVVARYDAQEKAERKDYGLRSFGAQFAEVRVDQDLGEVRVTRFVGAFAAGKILNAKTGRSQFLGGIVWGIGMALLEGTVRDAGSGRVVTRELADYHVPTHLDIPSIDVVMIDETDPHVNEVGAKGIGELGATGVAAAIANAVYHATGKRVRDLPIRLDELI